MKIIVGISAGIAAYKTPDLVRRLRDKGFEVRVVMTEGAKSFIGELSLQAVSGHPVHSELMDPSAEAAMGHIELARWADAIVIAPATANIMAKAVQGIADDLLTTLLLASPAKLFMAPAMNQQMWQHPAVVANAELLKQRGVGLIGPDSGEQACGDIGPGRMTEPQRIADHLTEILLPNYGLLASKRVLITAGPTQEPIDPVRYLTNHSSGKMGYALAEAARQAGAEVTLISGPVNLAIPSGVRRYSVTSATDMHQAVMQNLSGQDVFIGCAAVADYRLESPAKQKLKKSGEQLVLTMVENPDIIAGVAKQPKAPFCVGFAAETQDAEDFGTAKLESKGLDMICVNDVSDPEIGFNSDYNRITILKADGQPVVRLDKTHKMDLAQTIIKLISESLR